MEAMLDENGVLNGRNLSSGQLAKSPDLIFAAELALFALDMSLFLGQMLHRAMLALLFELTLAALRRLARRIGCMALIVDEAGAFICLISESCHFLAQILQNFD